jgi:hypothetical protein
LTKCGNIAATEPLIYFFAGREDGAPTTRPLEIRTLPVARGALTTEDQKQRSRDLIDQIPRLLPDLPGQLLTA